MKRLAFVLGIGFLFLLIGQAKAYDENYYLYQSSSTSDFSVTGHINVSADNGTCLTEMRVYADINGSSPYNYIFDLYVNDVLVVENPSITGTSPQTCVPAITGYFVNQTAFKARARAKTFGAAFPANLYLEFSTSCTTNNGDVIIWSNDTNSTLTYGNNMYSPPATIFHNQSDASHFWGGTNNIPAHCTASGLNPSDNIALANGGNDTAWYYVPFSSGRGNVQIYWRGLWQPSYLHIFGIYDPENNATTIIFMANSSQQTLTSDLNLEPYHDFVAYAMIRLGTGSSTFQPPNMVVNVSDYVPTFVCSAWSNCTGGSQTRLCNDTGGVLPLTYQTRNCLLVNETAVLGFEDYYVPFNRQICQNSYFPACLIAPIYIIANVTVLFPDKPRWVISPNNPFYYVSSITSETATQGSRSLKMWFIPQSPYNDQPFDNNGTVACGNTTTGTFPEIFLGINSTFMAALDFTFPSTTMQLKFDVKRCTENVIQYNNWCGKRCYSLNCTIPPRGWFTTNLYDQAAGTNVYEFTKEASDNWTTYTVDIGSNVVTDRNYTMIFSVLPLPYNPTETIGNCVYFDNVRLYNQQISTYDEWAGEIYNLPWDSLDITQKQTVLTQKCVSECVGDDFHSRTIQDLTCIEEVSLNYSTCVTQNQQQQQTQGFGNQSIFLPIISVCNAVTNHTTNQTFCQSAQASGFGFALLFLTPIFWIMMIVIAGMVLTAWVSRHMEIGIATGVILLIAMSSVFFELIWITIVVIVIAGYIIGRQVIRAVQG
jgi:hypothetical protein